MNHFKDKIIEKDKQLSKWVYLKGRNKLVKIITVIVAHSGDPHIWMAITGAVWYWGDSFMKEVMFRQFVIGFVLMLVSSSFKYTIKRSRPDYASASMYYVESLDKYSLPSGHSVRVGTVPVSIGVAIPFSLWLLMPWGIAVLISRVISGAHHILDVIVGVIFGSITTAIIIIFWVI
jgi:membrane-associated phospholipid phosphatase